MTLFRDPTVGVVQTPQHFVNPDPIQINLGATKFWPDEQRYFLTLSCRPRTRGRPRLLRHILDHPDASADGDRGFPPTR